VDELERTYWIAFARIRGIGRVRFQQIEAHFGSLADAWRATRADLKAAGLDEGAIRSIIAERPNIDPSSEAEQVVKAGVRAITWHDDDYPRQLREVYDRPAVLFVRGTLLASDEWAVAVVGTRRVSVYGRQVAEEMARGLAANRITVVSGLARGVDAIAHRSALEAGGRTIGVLACGLDLIYPPEHRRLAEQIVERGAIVSEYGLGVEPRGDFFPRRNRILSGMSLGVLVVEGDVKSGAMITARIASDQNREVFAVPGSIYSPNSRGPNRMIQEGMAKLTLDVQDILSELNLSMAPQQIEAAELIPADETESTVLNALGGEPMYVDDLRRECGLPIAVVTGALAMLELKGAVRQVGRMNYVRARDVAVASR
jgi:DNA processing protein